MPVVVRKKITYCPAKVSTKDTKKCKAMCATNNSIHSISTLWAATQMPQMRKVVFLLYFSVDDQMPAAAWDISNMKNSRIDPLIVRYSSCPSY